jgi:hypothetical protein
MDDVESNGGEASEVRHLTRLASGRLLRLVRGLIRKQCPTDGWGGCYWCGHKVFRNDPANGWIWVADYRVMHHPGCPWVEVIEYKQTEMFDGRSEARVPQGDDGPAADGPRPVD